jgi:enoyl-CoA hydratase
MEYHYVQVSIEHNVATVALNRTDALNALDVPLAADITESVRELNRRDDVRVIILKSNARIFCAGLDLKAFIGHDLKDSVRDSLNMTLDSGHYLLDCCNVLEECRKPVIAAVHGKCIGGGLDIACACDIRLCSEDASFSLREAGIGLVADMGVLQRVPLIIGQGFAREMAFTARYYTAREAERMGLVNQVFPDQSSLLEGATRLAREIAENAPLAIEGSKEVLNYSRNKPVGDGMAYAVQKNHLLFRTDDIKESARAFSERRKPRFQGR